MSLFGRKTTAFEQIGEGAAEAKARPKYGIDDALQLMRTLPVDQNAELVVMVVKNTLASMNVSLKDIVGDAVAKEEVTAKKIRNLQENIADLEEQIRERKALVSITEAELAELVSVRERLQAALDSPEAANEVTNGHGRGPAVSAGPRPPAPPARAKAVHEASRGDGDRNTMEVRDSAIEIEPAQAATKAP